MHGGSSTRVTGQEGLQHVGDFYSSALTNNEAIGSHPKRFPEQSSKPEFPRTLDIGLPCLQRDRVWVVDAKLCDIFHDE